MAIAISELGTRADLVPATPGLQDTDLFEVAIADLGNFQLSAVDLRKYVADNLVPSTTGTKDVGSTAVKFRDAYFTGQVNAATGSFTGTMAIVGLATFTLAPVISALTANQAVFTDGVKGLVSNAITGSGNVVMSVSPTLTGTITAAAANFSAAVSTGALTVTTGGVAITGNSTITGTLGGITNLTTSGTINSQTISATASFTGSVTVANGFTVSAGNSSVQALTANDTITILRASGSTPTLSLNQSGVTAWTFENRATSGLLVIATGGNDWISVNKTTGLLSIGGGFSIGATGQMNGHNLAWDESGVRSWTLGVSASTGNFTVSSGDNGGIFRVGMKLMTNEGIALNAGTAPSSGIQFGSSAPGTLANGQMWYDGTDFKVRQAGATKTVVLA